jgi:glycine hydroxymethyltransferase
MLAEILDMVNHHEEWRGQECLNLIPSENIMSPTVRSLLSSELGHRYTSRKRFYMGTKFLDEIELYGENIAKTVFGAKTADLRPLSGHVSDWIFLSTFTSPNDNMLCVSPDDGGYPGMYVKGLATLLKLRVKEFPFSKEKMNIKVSEAVNVVLRERPNVVVFGASFFLFPHPVQEITSVAREVGAVVGYDGSHVLGLIAGKEFQLPFKEGVNTLLGSTHKTFFGPQGGIILADKEHGECMKEKIEPMFVDNAHWNRVAALTLALAEMKEFGQQYAKQVIQNAKKLAKTLAEYNFPLACAELGFTESHQVLLSYGNYEKRLEIARKLEEANIIADCGMRLGTCEVTRRGMKEEEMEQIAEFVRRVVIDKEETEKVKKDVKKFVKDFNRIEYCFKT